jgi:hypothetical protein
MTVAQAIKKIIMIPIWVVQLVTTSKSFEANPIIGSQLLNRLGLHVIRLVLSHAIMGARMTMLSYQVSKQDRQFYRKNGYLLKTDFLAADQFQQLADEANNYKGETREGRQGNTLTQRAVMSPEARQQVPVIATLLASRDLSRLTQFTAGTFRAPFYYIEQVKNHHLEGEEDPQKNFHTDTFHPTMKCWYFLEDVTLEKGPFTYVPESSRLTWARIKMEYRKSVLGKHQENRYAKRGSMRYSDEELAELGLPKPKAFVVPANSLVIANTFGIHKRTESGKSTRLGIYGDSRTNPFIPVPSVPSQLLDEWQYKLLDLFRLKADRKAAKRGGRSPWYVVGK